MCAYLAHAEEGSGHSGFEDDEDIARKSSPNKTPKNLCNNFVGCTCNGKHDRAECSCLAMQLHEVRYKLFDLLIYNYNKLYLLEFRCD